ncbi:hypothetical protein G1K52_11560 [Tenacibaculum finnmarkense]|uniref:hypothetical protein n=1 Tax=Tenacibaculum finnmarkense TaxID=2781243 RepID=UPI001EFA3DD6|nr:hypothetical protein [Tenacibaculum finnmarkense]MCG8786395.1 hypothetical protein [Tenacibaculum finnmarkense]MCG8796663.1 hypothetical protein [Tenacibaculum finnmarkense]MCG8799007.1 hypothetical protein [Tenacibaculum finnmarkense]
MTFEEFKNRLKTAKTEETVKAIYAKYFKIDYNTADKHDLYTPQVLFEFKYDKNFQNLKALATILAQALYYIRRLKYGDTQKMIPYFLCLADKNEASLTETNKWSSYYSNDNYDWERPPSKPDPKLIDHLVKEPETGKLHVYLIYLKGEHSAFKKNLDNALNPQMILDFGDKKIINEENFEAVFDHWKNILGKYIVNGYKDSFYFLSNIQKDKIIVDRENSRVVFTFEDKNSRTQKVLMKDYDYFWEVYDYVKSQDTINGIHAKLDRLTDDNQRRFEGEFYTPLRFGKKAVHYITETLGKNWYKTGKYRIWDMAAGTGNLEYHLPAESYKYLYMSTLHASEADHLKKVFPNANCFQYDYLNDDVEYLLTKDNLPFEPNWKLPKKLRDELKDESITWLVYINPPFATAQVGGAKGESKKGVSKTKVEVLMDKQNTGHVKRELFAQFMFRLSLELPKKTYLGMFSKLKYLNAPDSIAYRDRFFNYKYESGFLFKSTNFNGVKGKYPICFLLWNLSKEREQKSIAIDITDDSAKTIGAKHLQLIDKGDVINKWFERPKNSNDYILPPLSNGISVRANNTDIRHRARPDFLASICSKGNDFQNSKYVVILSSPSVSAGAFTVNKDNFEKALTLHAVRKIPKPTWLNDRNQFLVPQTELTQVFINDCVIWSLLASSNETTSLSNVEYLGDTYQIKNNFFPFKIEELKKWEVKDPDFRQQLSKDEDRFVAKWLHKNELSEEAKSVLSKAKEVYKFFYSHLNEMATHNWKIDTWDAGWYQIRRSLTEHNFGADELNELKIATDELAYKILPQIEEFGFLDKDEVYEEI